MFSEVSDMVNKIKETAMKAQLPSQLPTKMKEKFLEMSHRMSPAEIAEVGRKFHECQKKAFEEFKEKQKEKERNLELLIQRMSSRH